jgi:hypothetical protein
MIKLADILKEIEAEPVITDLGNLDDEIKKAIENAPKNEIIGTISLVLAVPGIINAIMKVINVIAKKSGLNLKKKNDPVWYKVIEKVTGEIDDYLDTPFRVVLTPFIKDSIKRDKTAKILKALTLAAMAILGAVDPSKIQPTINSIKELSGNFGGEIVQAITEHSLPKLTEILKSFINSIKL